MADNDDKALAAHNARVRRLAVRMPDADSRGLLWRAVCAIGYRANKHSGVTSGWSLNAMADESRNPANGAKPRYNISSRSLDTAVQLLKEAGVLTVKPGPFRASSGSRLPAAYTLDYGWEDTERASAVLECYRDNRRTRYAMRCDRQQTRSHPVPASGVVPQTQTWDVLHPSPPTPKPEPDDAPSGLPYDPWRTDR